MTQDPNLRSTPLSGTTPVGASAVPPEVAVTEQPAAPADASYERYRAEDRSLGEIASDLLSNASTLIRQEVELAKAEVKQSATQAGMGVGLLAGAAVFGLLALIALTLCLWWVLAVAIGSQSEPALGWSGLLVMVIWLIVAAILAVAGRNALKKMQGLPKTQETVQKIPNAVVGNEEKNQ